MVSLAALACRCKFSSGLETNHRPSVYQNPGMRDAMRSCPSEDVSAASLRQTQDARGSWRTMSHPHQLHVTCQAQAEVPSRGAHYAKTKRPALGRASETTLQECPLQACAKSLWHMYSTCEACTNKPCHRNSHYARI